MNPHAKALYGQARATHWVEHDALVRLDQALKGSGDLNAHVDVIYALKQCSKLFEDLRKECDKHVEDLIKKACALWCAQGDATSIRTEYCTATPSVKQTVVTPKEGTPEYKLLLDYFGVPEGTPFRPHWPSMRDRVAKDMAEGKPVPPGCDPNQTQTIFAMKCLKRKPILGDGEATPVTDVELLRRHYQVLTKLSEFVDLEYDVMQDQMLADASQEDDEKPELPELTPEESMF